MQITPDDSVSPDLIDEHTPYFDYEIDDEQCGCGCMDDEDPDAPPAEGEVS